MRTLLTCLILLLLALPAAAQTATPTPTPTFPPTATYRPPGTGPNTSSRDCGYGLPCGPIPWNLPVFPILASPSPMPTFFLTATPTPTNTFTPTFTPTNFTPSPTWTNTPTATSTFTPTVTYTPSPLFDTQSLADSLATAQGMLDSTPISVEIAGTPLSLSDQIATAAPQFTDIFGRVKGFFEADFGPFELFFQTAFVVISLTLLLIAITYLIPFIAFIFGMARKIYTAITDLIPF